MIGVPLGETLFSRLHGNGFDSNRGRGFKSVLEVVVAWWSRCGLGWLSRLGHRGMEFNRRRRSARDRRVTHTAVVAAGITTGSAAAVFLLRRPSVFASRAGVLLRLEYADFSNSSTVVDTCGASAAIAGVTGRTALFFLGTLPGENHSRDTNGLGLDLVANAFLFDFFDLQFAAVIAGGAEARAAGLIEQPTGECRGGHEETDCRSDQKRGGDSVLGEHDSVPKMMCFSKMRLSY